MANVSAVRSAILVTGLILSLALGPASADSVDQGQWEDVLKIVARDVEKNYYDPKLNGLDWPALTEQARQRIRATQNGGAMMLAIMRLLNELHDSHTFFIPPRITQSADFGFKAKAIGSDIVVYDLTPKGPAARAGLQKGDRLLAINGEPVDRDTVYELMWIYSHVAPVDALD